MSRDEWISEAAKLLEETRATSNPYVQQFINGQRKLLAEAD